MGKRARWLTIFENGEKIVALFFIETDLDLVIDAEIHSQCIVQLPAELVIFYRRHNAEQAGIFKKSFRQIMIVNG